MEDEAKNPRPISVALLVTCLVDLMRPNVGFAAVNLLQDAGCTVTVPRAQSCCGQPAYNSGDESGVLAIWRLVIEVFDWFDAAVGPPGECRGMVGAPYPPPSSAPRTGGRRC